MRGATVLQSCAGSGHVQQLILTLIAVVACASASSGQRLQTHTISQAEGLPDVRVTDIAQGPDGQIWIATRGGVFEYDGTHFKSHLSGVDLPAHFFPERIATDASGGVWLVGMSSKNGLLHLTASGWQGIPAPDPSDRHGPFQELEVLEQPNQPARIVYLAGASVHLWDGIAWAELSRPTHMKDNLVSGVHVFEGAIYLATSGGIEVLPAGAAETESVFELPDPSDELTALLVTRTSAEALRIWIAGENWVGYFEDSTLVRTSETSLASKEKYVRRIQLLEDGRDGLYYGSGTRLYHYDPETALSALIGIHEGLASEGATSLLRDRDNNVWVSSMRGLTRIPPQEFENFGQAQGLLDDEVTAILELPALSGGENKQLIFGHNWGLSLRNAEAKIRKLSWAPNDLIDSGSGRVLDLCDAKDGGYWIASIDLGLGYAGRPDHVEWTAELPSSVNSIAREDDGKLWIATPMGLWVRDIGAHFRRDDVLGTIPIRRVQLLSNGDLLACAQHRGIFLHRAGEWAALQDPSDDESDMFYAALLDSKGKTWLGSSRGLFYLDGDVVRRHEAGFRIENPVYACLEDSRGTLWFGTSNGVFTWRDGSLTHLGVLEGLAGNEVNRAALIEDSAGCVWIGTDRGVSRYLGPFEGARRPVEVEILEMQWSDPGSAQRGAQPVAGYSDLEILFRAITFAGNGEAYYRAQLVGFDLDWLPERKVGEGLLRYTNLPPGKYFFRIEARAANGEWGPTATTETFTMVAPFWERGWFLALGLAAFGVIVATSTAFLLARKRSAGLEIEVLEVHEALATTERSYSEMFEQNPSALLLIDPKDGRVLKANSAAAEYFGNSPEALSSQTLSDLTGVSSERLIAEFGNLKTGEEWFLRPGEEDPVFGPPIEIRASLFTFGGEQVLQATIHDMEARLRLEQERVETLKLRAAGELASGVAHDFNNLLTAILGHNQLIEIDSKGDTRLIDHVARIRSAGEQGSRLVRQLLAFGRRQRLMVEVLDMNQVLKEMSGLMQSIVGSRISCGLELSSESVLVLADRKELEELLMSLLLAARGVMPDGGRLKFQTVLAASDMHPPSSTHGDPNTPYVRLSLDISTSKLAEAPAARNASDSTEQTSPAELLGLRLCTVQDLIQHSGGRVRTRIRAGGELSIDVHLPSAHEELSTPAEGASREEEGEQDSRGQCVLVVDDDVQVRQTIAALLRPSGFKVIEAAGAEEARTKFREASEPIELLITDIKMPVEDGRKLGASLCQLDPKLRVIYMSGYYDEAVASDNEVFLSKPFTLSKLNRALDRAGLPHLD